MEFTRVLRWASSHEFILNLPEVFSFRVLPWTMPSATIDSTLVVVTVPGTCILAVSLVFPKLYVIRPMYDNELVVHKVLVSVGRKAGEIEGRCHFYKTHHTGM